MTPIPYHPTCLLVRAASQILGIPQPVTCTALTFVHRVYAHSGSSIIPLRRVVQSCIFLACKVEEHPVKISDLINTVHILLTSSDQSTSSVNPPVREVYPELASSLLPLNSEPPIYVGSQYYEQKDLLLADERTILQLLEYEVSIRFPHATHVYSACACPVCIYVRARVPLSLNRPCSIYQPSNSQFAPHHIQSGPFRSAPQVPLQFQLRVQVQ